MIIKDINKRVHNTPENINEELAPISDEHIRNLFKDVSGDESNPLDYYTKIQTDVKIREVNNSIETVKGTVSTVENTVTQIEKDITTIESDIDGINTSIVGIQTSMQELQEIHYSTVDPTNDQGKDGDLWIIYEG